LGAAGLDMTVQNLRRYASKAERQWEEANRKFDQARGERLARTARARQSPSDSEPPAPVEVRCEVTPAAAASGVPRGGAGPGRADVSTATEHRPAASAPAPTVAALVAAKVELPALEGPTHAAPCSIETSAESPVPTAAPAKHADEPERSP